MRKSIKTVTKELSFKLRTAGIVVNNNKILFVTMDDNKFLCLPGGYVELGETTEEACLREMKEETRKDFKVEKFCGVIENFFTNKYNLNIHELSFYYLLSPCEDVDTKDFELIENDKGNIVKLNFKWIDIAELDKYNIQPKELKDILKKNLEFTHIVIDKN